MTDNEKPEQSLAVVNEKPEELIPPSHILIKIKGQDESEVLCKIRRNAQLNLFMDQYCEKRSMDINTIQFLFDEKLLNRVQTAEEVGLEDGDEIDAMLHQQGGAVQLQST